MRAKKPLMRLVQSLMTTTICLPLVALGMMRMKSQPAKWKKSNSARVSVMAKICIGFSFGIGSFISFRIVLWCSWESGIGTGTGIGMARSILAGAYTMLFMDS